MRARAVFAISVLAAVAAVLLSSCSRPQGRSASALDWSSVDDWLYILQDIDIEAVGKTKFDLVVMDYSSDGSEEGRFSRERIERLKSSPGGPKLVLCYISIGEAESYRWYWDDSWDADRDGMPDEGAPDWLGEANPEWPDNYPVKFWDDGWRQIVFEHLDMILEAGFDGVYLDRVDVYEYWGPGGESGLNRETAEDEMVEFVKEIADYVRARSGNDDFGVFPQNAEELAEHGDYLAAVTGIGKEDLWYDGNEPQPADCVGEARAYLDMFRDAGKVVLVVDYVIDAQLIDDFYAKAEAAGYIPYATTRELDRITINEGHEPD